MAEPVVDVRDLSKTYDGREVVREVSIYLKSGDLIGLVGANGGGKTTTLRMLAGLVRPDGGSGTVLGSPIGSAGPDRAQIGFMSQRLALYPELTVLENLRFRARIYGLALASVEHAVATYRLESVARSRFGILSGGWARRVQFAASVIHAPPLLLLDEPTAGLDVVTRNTMWDWMFAFADADHAIVVSTHDLAEAERLPQVVLFGEGRAAPQTTPEVLRLSAGVATLEAAVLAGASS